MASFAHNGRWDAAAFFESLTASNKLAQSEQFVFCRVSGLDGFEEAVAQMQSVSAFVCVSDVADGYTELNNTPRTRRIKTVFFAMRHAAEDMETRSECMETMRELFRQFMSRLLPEKGFRHGALSYDTISNKRFQCRQHLVERADKLSFIENVATLILSSESYELHIITEKKIFWILSSAHPHRQT